jgi:VWFA-related protein
MTSLGALLLSGLPLAALAGIHPVAGVPATEPPAAQFGEQIAVRLRTVVVRVIDGEGRPITGLAPADFRLRVGGKEVPVTAVDWYSSAPPEPAPGQVAERSSYGDAPAGSPLAGLPAAGSPAAAPTHAAASSAGSPAAVPAATAAQPGQQVVVFVEADNNEPGRVRGHLRTLPFTRELLASLAPEDRVAVVSFDSHLKLWQDFTRERAAAHEAIWRAIHFGGRPPELPADDPAALAAHLDLEKARQAASPERALAVTADALAGLPGEKVVVFLGWGLGCFGSFGTRMVPAFAPAVAALKAARAAVFVLDVTEAGSHDLEVGLQAVAEATGGTYDSTFTFPGLAVAHLAHAISGYYVLSLDPAAIPSRGGPVSAELRRRPGTVLVRPVTLAR